jgi:hypothetical protein
MVGTDVKNQYDTYVKTPASDEAYVGYVYNSDTLVSKIVFAEGKHFENGGWFDGEVRVEVLIGGEWKKVDTAISTPYPKGDEKKDFGAEFETYVFTLKAPCECRGVRIIGKAGGSAKFISVSELTVE